MFEGIGTTFCMRHAFHTMHSKQQRFVIYNLYILLVELDEWDTIPNTMLTRLISDDCFPFLFLSSVDIHIIGKKKNRLCFIMFLIPYFLASIA